MNSRGLGRKLRAYRAKRGWSLKECSERIGISTRYLADIERGDKVPKLETFVSILNTLSASADDVLFCENWDRWMPRARNKPWIFFKALFVS